MLGDDIMGSGFSFHIHVHAGAGAYVCGEETALLESMEGKRGIPRIRPPYPTVYGYHGMPTVVNNVETLANVPPILLNGAAWYRTLGTKRSPGTRSHDYGRRAEHRPDRDADGRHPAQSRFTAAV